MFVDSLLIKGIAQEVGFDACGICDAFVDSNVISSFETWLTKKYNAEMSYMERNIDVRKNLQKLLDNAQSVISVLYSYNTDEHPDRTDFRISKYAIGADYHIVIKEKLQRMLLKIKDICPSAEGRCFVDSAPLFERYFAQKCGLGFIGRNKCLINPKFGSFVFLGELVVNFESNYDTALSQTCLNCNACIKNCPTGALKFDGINANKCISYQTIEKKGNIDDDLINQKGNWIFGCDQCQICCPHNFSIPHKNGIIMPEIKSFSPENLIDMSNNHFRRKYNGSALLRAGRSKILTNWQTDKEDGKTGTNQ